MVEFTLSSFCRLLFCVLRHRQSPCRCWQVAYSRASDATFAYRGWKREPSPLSTAVPFADSTFGGSCVRKDCFKDFYVQLHTIAPHSGAHTASQGLVLNQGLCLSLSVMLYGSSRCKEFSLPCMNHLSWRQNKLQPCMDFSHPSGFFSGCHLLFHLVREGYVE